jgi:uncharacterized membrane protein YeaQ/YmgE (transglycosylase-associated protein family)
MGIISWIIVGLIAGWLASMVMKTDASQGAMMDIIMGVLGGVVGGFLMNMMGFAGTTGLNVYSILVATLGAIVLIGVGRALKVGG